MDAAITIGIVICALALVGAGILLKRRADKARMARYEAQAEAAYDGMNVATNPTDVAARYSDAKDALADAMAIARRLGRQKDYERLSAQLAHIRAVLRSRFGVKILDRDI